MKRNRIVMIVMLCMIGMASWADNVAGVDIMSTESTRHRPADRFYDYAGKSSLSILNIGYTYDILDKKHLLGLGLLEFRCRWFGLSPLNVELGIGPHPDREGTMVSQWVAYKPMVRFYIPFCKMLAISPYGGVAIDMTGVRPYFDKGYQYEKENNYFLDVIAGLSLHIDMLASIPMEICAEYRYPVVMNQRDVLNQGIYVGARIHFASPFGRKH